jgi:DNA-binding NtrC family response regulator
MALEIVLGSAGSEGSRTPAPRGASGSGSRLRALIVDDEPSICRLLAATLSDVGYEAVTAQSGESALAIIRGEHIDILLLDFRIPDMRGDIIFEFAAATQPHLAYQTLFMTGDILDSSKALIRACKCNYLQKPFELDVLTDALAAIAPRAEETA